MQAVVFNFCRNADKNIFGLAGKAVFETVFHKSDEDERRDDFGMRRAIHRKNDFAAALHLQFLQANEILQIAQVFV